MSETSAIYSGILDDFKIYECLHPLGTKYGALIPPDIKEGRQHIIRWFPYSYTINQKTFPQEREMQCLTETIAVHTDILKSLGGLAVPEQHHFVAPSAEIYEGSQGYLLFTVLPFFSALSDPLAAAKAKLTPDTLEAYVELCLAGQPFFLSDIFSWRQYKLAPENHEALPTLLDVEQLFASTNPRDYANDGVFDCIVTGIFRDINAMRHQASALASAS